MAENETTPPRLPIEDNIQTPRAFSGSQQADDESIRGEGFNGTLQQILSQNTGHRVIIDFLVGTGNIIRKEGILYLVGVSYIVLYDDKLDIYTVCNIYSIEFVTFLSPNGTNQNARATLKRV